MKFFAKIALFVIFLLLCKNTAYHHTTFALEKKKDMVSAVMKGYFVANAGVVGSIPTILWGVAQLVEHRYVPFMTCSLAILL